VPGSGGASGTGGSGAGGSDGTGGAPGTGGAGDVDSDAAADAGQDQVGAAGDADPE
jgi:hypothetical protein